MFKSIITVAVLIFGCSIAHAADIDNVDFTDAYRVYDADSGNIVVDVAFEPTIIKYDGEKVVTFTICESDGSCNAWEFINILYERIDSENFVR